MIKRFLIICFLLCTGFFSLNAQIQEGQVLDKVIAIVGDEIIMRSDIDSYMISLKQQNPAMALDDKEIRQRILDQLIDDKLVITKAIEDSIEVTDQEIEQRIDYFIADLVRRFGSEKRAEDVYGMSMSRIKREYSDIVKKQILSERIKQTKFMSVEVTDPEVREFYEAFKDSLPTVPESVEMYHISLNVEADLNSRDNTLALARKIRDSILNHNASFSLMAKRYSNDPGTKDDGGELGWFNRGRLVPEFEKAAFKLNKGEISLPIETPFGFHVIETLDKKVDKINTRHILFKVKKSEGAVDTTLNKLKEIRQMCLDGQEFESLAKRFSADKETRGFGGFIGKVPVNELPALIKDELLKLNDGEITDPKPYKADPTKEAYHIIYKKRYIPAHTPNLEDDFKEIKAMAKSNKVNKKYEDWIKGLRKTMYWEIKEDDE